MEATEPASGLCRTMHTALQAVRASMQRDHVSVPPFSRTVKVSRPGETNVGTLGTRWGSGRAAAVGQSVAASYPQEHATKGDSVGYRSASAVTLRRVAQPCSQRAGVCRAPL